MDLDHNAPPVHPLPGVAWLLVLPMAGLEAVFQAGEAGVAGGPAGLGWRLSAVQAVAVSHPVLDWIGGGHAGPFQLVRFLAYPFVQTNVTLAIFVCVILLAMAKFVAEAFSSAAVLAVFVASTLAGGLFYSLLPWSEMPLYGGMPPVYGLIGAFTWAKWREARAAGHGAAGAFRLIGVLLGFQLFLGGLTLVTGEPSYLLNIVAAKAAGFATGFGLSFLVRPGGGTALVARLRAR